MFTKIIKFQQDWLLVLLFLTFTSLIFWFTSLDIRVQTLFFNASTRSWDYAALPFWNFLYQYGIFLGYVLALLSLLLIAVTYWRPTYIFWRKPAMLMIFVVLFGPGILVNVILKDQWGRPRPREITVFGGQEDYCWVAVPNFGGEGKSFPCGHCAIAFYLAVPYFFLRKKYKGLSIFFLFLGISYGFLMGVARMMAGAHFLSDVLWSAGAVWVVTLVGMQLLKTDKPIIIPDIISEQHKKKAKRATLVIGIMIPILTVSLLLATPYISKKEFQKSPQELTQVQHILTQLNEGETYINIDKSYKVNYKVNAFGFPNSKLRYEWHQADTSIYQLLATGWFTEIRNRIEVMIPEGITHTITLEQGNVYWDLSQNMPIKDISINIEEGNVYFYVTKDTKLQIENLSNSKIVTNLKNISTQSKIISQGKIDNSAEVFIKIYLKKGEIHLLPPSQK